MSNLSNYASNLLYSRNNEEARHDPRASTQGGPSSMRRPRDPIQAVASSSHFQLDPLLKSTFGHRSSDLYGSQLDQEYDHQRAGESGTLFDDSPQQSRRFGGSSLINASRYGPSKSRSGTAAIPEIEDEQDDGDDDDDEGEDDAADATFGRRWGRGVDVRAFVGSFGEERQTRKPATRDDANASGSSTRRNRQIYPDEQGVDPFLIDHDEDTGEHLRSESGTQSASGDDSEGPPQSPIGHRPQSSGQDTAQAAKRPKGKAPERPPIPRRDISAGRGWIAHSIAQPHDSSRPVRDAYSIYDDEDDGIYSEEEDDGSEASDDDGQEHLGSTIHHPNKMTASSIPSAAKGASRAGDNFYQKVTDPENAAVEASGIIDEYAAHPSLASDLNSWNPLSKANNPTLRQWKDSGALVVWLVAAGTTLFLAGGASLGVKSPRIPATPSVRPSPYYTLTRSLPLLILLTALSLAMASVNLLFLRNLHRLGGAQVLHFALISTPVILTVGWLWAFAGSFFYQDEQWTGGTWTTTGLRMVSLFPLACALLFSRMLYVRRNQLTRSIAVLSLSAKIISTHPTLLILSLVHIGAFLVVSIPFLTIFVRLFTLGHFSDGEAADAATRGWVTDRKARILAWITLGTWLWTWAALRGIMRVVVASTVSHYYFHGPPSPPEDRSQQGVLNTAGTRPARPKSADVEEADSNASIDENKDVTSSSIIGLGDSQTRDAPGAWTADDDSPELETSQLDHRNPTADAIVRSAFLRATGPSLGTILLSALLLAVSRAFLALSYLSRTLASLLTSPSIPGFLHPLAHVAYLLSGVGGVIKGISDYTLIYTGITGRGFWTSSRRCGRIITKRGVKGIVEGELRSAFYIDSCSAAY